jgi:hypothetical protein
MDRPKPGTRRSLMVEANGVPTGLPVRRANVKDFKSAWETIESTPVE